jgi:hypothetical protein
MSKYEQHNLNPFCFSVDRGTVEFPDDCVPNVINLSHDTVREFENEELIKTVRDAYERACRILARDDIGSWFYQHVSNLADELHNFLNLIEAEGTP